jgi:transcriptional regulator with XRE-family HTH domain
MRREETDPPRERLSEDLGRAIRVLRTLRDLTRPELAEEAGVSYSYLSEIEKGTKLPSGRVLASIADALKVSVEELNDTADDLAGSVAAMWEPSPDAAREESSPYPAIRRAIHTGLEGGTSTTELSMLVADTSPVPTVSAVLRSSQDVLAQTRWASRSTRSSGVHVPDELLSEIQAGNCVAFVGAGFSAAAGAPTWATLLRQVAKRGRVPKQVRAHVEESVAQGSSSALYEAAQVLEDQLGRSPFLEQLQQLLGRAAMKGPVLDRVQLLHGIPFRSILTTNFDGSLAGATPSHEAYRAALRPGGGRWWEPRYWGGEGAFTVKLHGDLGTAADTAVLTRRDYRRRLYEDPAYETFLRAIMATTTVLYMGFSFEDAYLNELRSEILALVGHHRESAPVAYAIVNDVPDRTVRHFRAHEGIELLPYDTQGKDGVRDFSGFDDYLEAIHEGTNPLRRFGRHLEHKRILWVDPHPENNALAFEQLSIAARLSGRRKGALVTVSTPEQGLARLHRDSRGDPFDLAITHWGAQTGLDEQGQPTAAAVRLLEGIRKGGLRCPVIVFAAMEDVDQRKRTALGLGAQAYCFYFETLFQTIERILAPGYETG